MPKTILNNLFLTSCLCFLLLAGLWLPDILAPHNNMQPDSEALMPLQSWLIRDLGLSGEKGLWYALLFTVLSAVLLFIINRRHLFAGNHEKYMLLSYFLLTAAMPSSLYFSGAQVAAIGILLSIYFLFNSYQQQRALPAIFSATLFASIAGLFYSPATGAAIAIFISIMLSRSFTWRDGAAFLGGLSCPYFYLWLYYFLNDYAPGHFVATLAANRPSLYLPNIATNFYEYIYIATLGLLALWSLLAAKPPGIRKIKTVHMRQYFNYLLFCFLLSTIFLHPSNGSIMTLTAIPLSVITATTATQIRRKKLYMLAILILLTVIIGSRIS